MFAAICGLGLGVLAAAAGYFTARLSARIWGRRLIGAACFLVAAVFPATLVPAMYRGELSWYGIVMAILIPVAAMTLGRFIIQSARDDVVRNA